MRFVNFGQEPRIRVRVIKEPSTHETWFTLSAVPRVGEEIDGGYYVARVVHQSGREPLVYAKVRP